jgi:hypothetical protein
LQFASAPWRWNGRQRAWQTLTEGNRTREWRDIKCNGKLRKERKRGSRQGLIDARRVRVPEEEEQKKEEEGEEKELRRGKGLEGIYRAL